MKKSFLAFLVMVGTVIGSGFLSGKEIVVFFTRFGILSFPCIFFAFFLFWGLFHFMLNFGSKAINRLNTSKFSNILNIFICVVLAGAMFSGSFELLSFGNHTFTILIMFFVVLICFYIIKHGLGSLEKVNLYLVPIMLIALVIGEILLLGKGNKFQASLSSFACIYYALMYVILNTANSGVVIAHIGKELSAKQKARVSFCSALVLSLLLLLTNIVLLKNQNVFGEEMPLLSLFEGGQGLLMQIVILFGCLTTLFSLVFNLSSSLKGLMKNEIFSNILSVFAPLVFSFIGFGRIVSYFYPISSVLGVFLLADLFLLPFFKQTYKSIHSTRKHTK